MNANDLIRALVMRLSASGKQVDEAQVDEMLEAFTARVRGEVLDGGRSVVPGFGVFLRGDVGTSAGVAGEGVADEGAADAENMRDDQGSAERGTLGDQGSQGVRGSLGASFTGKPAERMVFVPNPGLAMRINAWNTGMEAVDLVSGEVSGVPAEGRMDVWDDEREQQWQRDQAANESVPESGTDVESGADERVAGGVADGVAGGEDLAGGNAGPGSSVPGASEVDGESAADLGVGHGAESDGNMVAESAAGESETRVKAEKEEEKEPVLAGDDFGGGVGNQAEKKGSPWIYLRVAVVLVVLGLMGWQLTSYLSEWMENGGRTDGITQEAEVSGMGMNGSDGYDSEEAGLGEIGSGETGLGETGRGSDVSEAMMSEAGEQALGGQEQVLDEQEGAGVDQVGVEQNDAGVDAGAEVMDSVKRGAGEAAAGERDGSTDQVAERVAEDGAERVTGQAAGQAAEEIAARGAGWGLMGGSVDPEEGGFGIILYSLTSEVRADRILEELKEEEYKTYKMVRKTEDGSLFRVVVGQFATVEDALAAAGMLPEPYRSNYFISRIK